ncbi:unnamed protein product [Sphagnum jensenii]|uniref:Uncharacterized protein n=1 Tax=Sphagnum jensenii TaxID=128206 RepID=A0ABP1A594_9BRYO
MTMQLEAGDKGGHIFKSCQVIQASNYNVYKPHNLHLLKPDKCAATFREIGCNGLWKNVSLCSYLRPPLLHWFSHQVPIGDSWRPPDKCSRPVQNLPP